MSNSENVFEGVNYTLDQLTEKVKQLSERELEFGTLNNITDPLGNTNQIVQIHALEGQSQHYYATYERFLEEINSSDPDKETLLFLLQEMKNTIQTIQTIEQERKTTQPKNNGN